jgi:hypothetical protein
MLNERIKKFAPLVALALFAVAAGLQIHQTLTGTPYMKAEKGGLQHADDVPLTFADFRVYDRNITEHIWSVKAQIRDTQKALTLGFVATSLLMVCILVALLVK